MMQQILKRRIEETAWKWSRLFPMHNEVIIPSPFRGRHLTFEPAREEWVIMKKVSC